MKAVHGAGHEGPRAAAAVLGGTALAAAGSQIRPRAVPPSTAAAGLAQKEAERAPEPPDRAPELEWAGQQDNQVCRNGSPRSG